MERSRHNADTIFNEWLITVEDYFQNVVKEAQSLARLQAEAKKGGLDKFPMFAIDREIRRIRKDR